MSARPASPPGARPHARPAGSPPAPCHPPSRADTVRTPPLAAQRRRRPVPHLVLVSVQVCRAGGVSGPAAPWTASRAAASTPRGPSLRSRGGLGAGDSGAGCGGGRRGAQAGAAVSAAPPNFLRGPGRRRAPLGAASLWPAAGQRARASCVRPPYLPPRGSSKARLHEPTGGRAAARLLNESPARPGPGTAHPHASRRPTRPRRQAAAHAPAPWGGGELLVSALLCVALSRIPRNCRARPGRGLWIGPFWAPTKMGLRDARQTGHLGATPDSTTMPPTGHRCPPGNGQLGRSA